MSPDSPRNSPEQYLIAIQMAVATLENRCRREGHGDWTRHTELIAASAACLADTAMADTNMVDTGMTDSVTTDSMADSTAELMESMAELLTQWRELSGDPDDDIRSERLTQVRQRTDQCLRQLAAGHANQNQPAQGSQQEQDNHQLPAQTGTRR